MRQLSRQQALLRLYPPILCFDGLLCGMYLLFHAVALGSGVTAGQPSAPLVDGESVRDRRTYLLWLYRGRLAVSQSSVWSL